MKKTLLIALVVAIVCVLAVGGTFAYLQDTSSDVNVMTMGNVTIEQNEYEFDENRNLVEFTQNKPLLPYVGDLGWTNVGTNGAYRQFTMNNVVDKYVTVENTGSQAAYVRTWIALEMGDFTADEFELIGISNNAYNGSEFQFDGAWDWDYEAGIAQIDGKNYYLMCATHRSPVEPGVETIPSLLQLYLSKDATNEDVKKLDGNDNGLYEVFAFSQAVQAAGFDDAKTALNTAFGTANPWVETTIVGSVEDLKAAIAAGEDDIVVTNAMITEKVSLGSVDNVSFVGCTFTANTQWSYAKNVSYDGCIFECDPAALAMHFDSRDGELNVNNCEFRTGKVRIGAGGPIRFTNCVFAETPQTSIWSEKGMTFYDVTTFENCEFNNRVVMGGSNGLDITFENCTMNGGTPVYYNDNTDGIIRGGNIPNVVIK